MLLPYSSESIKTPDERRKQSADTNHDEDCYITKTTPPMKKTSPKPTVLITQPHRSDNFFDILNSGIYQNSPYKTIKVHGLTTHEISQLNAQGWGSVL